MNIAIILAAGSGTRVGFEKPKQFIKIQGKPILAYTLEVFENNKNIDAIEIVCHKDWVGYVEDICLNYNISKKKWICIGGATFQESTINGIFNLKKELNPSDIVVLSFGAAPLTPQEDIDDSIRICKLHGNGIAAKDIDLCTCIKDDDFCSSRSILRESIKGFANPWSFTFGELCEAYEEAIKRGILDRIEPHTTSLYFELGKKIWFSQSTSIQAKITLKEDIIFFESYIQNKKN
ncbi:IspD/TarI family cytidylyltransferase [Desulfovibrio piger]|uniref:IspD/TarI family cytidylyltransferase n=1 Tax=Desulfovibrio piger TaxID=901 RepID=UPI0039F4C054